MGIDIYLKHHMLKVAGNPISVYESGEEDFPPVLLLHGAMYDEARFIWYHLAYELARTRRVFALDFPRHGSSRPWPGSVNREILCKAVEEVVLHFDLAPLPLIGLSMGGAVAMEYMLKHPEQITGAVLMGPGGLGDKVANQFLSWLFVKIPGVLAAMTKYYSRLSPEKMRSMLVSILETREASRSLEELTAILLEEAGSKWKYREAAMDDWQRDGLAPFRLKLNYLPELPRLSCPTLWLRGEKDPLVGQDVMEEAAKRAPNGRLLVIKKAGHLLPLEQPDEVNRAVLEFLEEHRL